MLCSNESVSEHIVVVYIFSISFILTLFLASLSSVFQDPTAADNNDAPVSLTTTEMVSLPPRSVTGTASEPNISSKFIPFYGGADYHDYHHYVGGQSQSNFASVFTYYDYIYGTDKGYRYQKKVLEQLRDGKGNDGSNASGQDIKSE
ncbi:unnamed protein product [Lactuca virosa]|uniref:Uncharacterized protein n=1 Tax=Lactuca virosa TaxID=75947 RepID=A0AAU9PD22_9ASTR|nr:unnamed protein product [Lactuca virosa]